LPKDQARRLRADTDRDGRVDVAEDDALARAFWESAGYEQQPNRVRFLRHLGGPEAR